MKKTLIGLLALAAFGGCATAKGLFQSGPSSPDFRRKWLTVTTHANQKLDLVRFTGRELGFDQPAAWSEILAAGQRLGLGLCPDSIAVPLRIEYSDQPEGEMLYLAMEPLREGYLSPNIYVVLNAFSRRVMDVVALAESFRFVPESIFVFVSR